MFLLLAPPGHGSAAAEDASALQPVRVQLKWAHQFQFAGYYTAIDQGYYEDAGLDVTLIEKPPKLNPVDQLMSGRADFAVADSGALIYRATGVPVVALAAIFQNSPSVLITLKESGIEELADLEGHRAMLTSGYRNGELMAMMATAGVTEDDISLAEGEGGEAIDALLDGRTDAFNGYTTNQPWLLERRGIPVNTFVPQDHGIDFYGDILLTSEALLERNPDKVRRFRAASLKGWEYAVENPDEIVELIYNEYNTQGKSREHLQFEAQETIDLILPNVVPVGYMSVERWQHIADVFAERGLVREEALDLAGFLYTVEPDETLWSTLWQHRVQISAWLAFLFAALMLTHIVRLRGQVRARTQQLEEAWRHAETEARTDALTGLPNRRHLVETLTPALALAERHSRPFALICMDLDLFKEINDQHGHDAGDKVLQSVAQRLRQLIRGSDFAARTGGEEFVIAAPNTDWTEAMELCERLRTAFADLVVVHEGKSIHLTCSFGVTLYRPGESMDELFKRADAALYDAKRSGRDRVCTCDR